MGKVSFNLNMKVETNIEKIEMDSSSEESVRLRKLNLARAELGAKDPVMRILIDAKPDLDYDVWRRTLPVKNLFEALLFQIVGQQISVSAANAIYARLQALFPGNQPKPEMLAQIH